MAMHLKEYSKMKFTFALLTFMQLHYLCVSKHPQKAISYEEARKAVIQAEDLFMTGGRTQLNDKELRVNDFFIKYKLGELSKGFHDDDQNAAALHFFKAKELIERSSVFKFLHQMPKGALLHVHSSASVSSKWVVRHISYKSGLLRCTNKDGVSILTFRRLPETHGCATQYVLVSDERARSADPNVYDRYFEKLINLYTKRPEYKHDTITKVWKQFQNMFITFSDALHYLPVYQQYHWQMLEEMYEDNIMYAEIRTTFKELYDISGRTFPADNTIRELYAINRKFIQYHPDFLGIKVIVSPHRGADVTNVKQQFEDFLKWHAAYPNFIIGFDLVGQEDLGKPLYHFVETLSERPKSVHYFFHAGETNWYGASTDFNLLDALLLNTTRIGHGFALVKHPALMNAAKERDIAIEISPISNQVLRLVWDLRNHPAAVLLSQNVPIVICSDDPGFWGTNGLSYDYYYAIMSMAPNNAGLRMLKTLVWNSIRYSTLNASERKRAYIILENNWNKFIDRVLEGNVF